LSVVGFQKKRCETEDKGQREKGKENGTSKSDEGARLGGTEARGEGCTFPSRAWERGMSGEGTRGEP
jgi:hypothetical protein